MDSRDGRWAFLEGLVALLLKQGKSGVSLYVRIVAQDGRVGEAVVAVNEGEAEVRLTFKGDRPVRV